MTTTPPPNDPDAFVLYVTFGQQYGQEPHPRMSFAHPDGWLEIEVRGAPDDDEAYDAARDLAFRTTGGMHAFDYTPDRWNDENHGRRDEWYPLGPLARITLDWPRAATSLEVFRAFWPRMVEVTL